MEESKDLITGYKIFRSLVYVSLVLEFFLYAVDPAVLDFWGGILVDLHGRMKRWFIYTDGNLIWSKVATLLLICVTCIGTRNKKQLEFDARRMVLYPLVSGLFIVVLSVWLFGHSMTPLLYTVPLNRWLYMAASVIGTVLVHIALDNISKFLKEGLMKDRFNYENESFVQCEERIDNKYSVNVPMRYYYKGKFRKGWVNIVNPFRGTWVVGTPGSGKTFSIIEPFIRQHSAKGFATITGSTSSGRRSPRTSRSTSSTSSMSSTPSASILSSSSTSTTSRRPARPPRPCWTPSRRERRKVAAAPTSSSRPLP